MRLWWPAAALLFIVLTMLYASQRPGLARIFRWTPMPLWCYLLPAIASSIGWLPRDPAVYRALTEHVLPIALALLLLGVDVPGVLRTGARALAAAAVGAVGIILGAALGIWWLRGWLPAESWKGAGALAGTWTGGTMNLLALRIVLEIPDQIFSSLILVDALIAYSWMALLVAVSGAEARFNRWCHAKERQMMRDAPDTTLDSRGSQPPGRSRRLIGCAALAVAIAYVSRQLAAHLPTVSTPITSITGWTILLVTTLALFFSSAQRMRRLGSEGARLGSPLLYFVLAATGAQAQWHSLWSAPAWLMLGVIMVVVHGVLLLACGRLLRVPLGLLATASQANIGGLVSAPLVGAVYHRSLAPVGLLLAMAGNALGTYAGMTAGLLSRWIAGSY